MNNESDVMAAPPLPTWEDTPLILTVSSSETIMSIIKGLLQIKIWLLISFYVHNYFAIVIINRFKVQTTYRPLRHMSLRNRIFFMYPSGAFVLSKSLALLTALHRH